MGGFFGGKFDDVLILSFVSDKVIFKRVLNVFYSRKDYCRMKSADEFVVDEMVLNEEGFGEMQSAGSDNRWIVLDACGNMDRIWVEQMVEEEDEEERTFHLVPCSTAVQECVNEVVETRTVQLVQCSTAVQECVKEIEETQETRTVTLVSGGSSGKRKARCPACGDLHSHLYKHVYTEERHLPYGLMDRRVSTCLRRELLRAVLELIAYFQGFVDVAGFLNYILEDDSIEQVEGAVMKSQISECVKE